MMSQIELTGAEVYAVSVANHQSGEGHEVHMFADELHLPTVARFTACPLHDRSYRARLRNVWALRKYVHHHKIDIVHAHSRASSWVAHYALKNTRVPYISTVHGRQHWHGRFKKNDVYGDQAIAVCENIRSHLIEEFGLRPGKVVTLGNPVDASEPRQRVADGHVRFSILGRTSGPKGQRASELLVHAIAILLRRFSFLKIQMAGGAFAGLSEAAKASYRDLRQTYGERLVFSEKHEDFWQFLLSSDVTLASGRIAAESLIRGIPTFAMGEAIVHGPVTTHNLADALASNFGDVQACRKRRFPFDVGAITEELIQFIASAPTVPETVRQPVGRHFDAAQAYRKIEQVYRMNIFKAKVPRPVPILMYHKIPSAPLKSKHKIFVVAKNFYAQMRALKTKGYTALDFTELRRFIQGEWPLDKFPKKPILLTFDDGYKDNLENAFPILKEMGFKATVFVLSNFHVRSNEWDTKIDPTEPPHELMTPEEIRRCQEYGVSIGSHGRSHRDLTALTKEESWQEIAHSKQELESTVETPVCAFAYPYGKFGPVQEQQTFEAGYEFAVATDSGAMRFEENPYAIFRVNIFPHDLGLSFFKKVSARYRQYFYWKRGR